jgi:hypothetical protein
MCKWLVLWFLFIVLASCGPKNKREFYFRRDLDPEEANNLIRESLSQHGYVKGNDEYWRAADGKISFQVTSEGERVGITFNYSGKNASVLDEIAGDVKK